MEDPDRQKLLSASFHDVETIIGEGLAAQGERSASRRRVHG